MVAASPLSLCPESRLKHFRLVASGLPVSALRSQILAQPELWDAHPGRTNEGSPHYGVPDIWVRYRAIEELTEPAHFGEPHFASFYPAWRALPALHPIVYGLMAREKAVYLGGILITKIPPGGEVKPHHDRGGWHAEFMNTKIYVGIQGNQQCTNYCEDESLVIRPGEAWTFNNLLTHSVVNHGDCDRITAIVCMRRE
jgi:hypothetical protein